MAEPMKRIYDSTTVGLPPLKMVLVHARNAAQNAAAGPASRTVMTEPEEEAAPLDKERIVRRIIERLEEME